MKQDTLHYLPEPIIQDTRARVTWLMAIFTDQNAAEEWAPERRSKGPVIVVIGASYYNSRLSDPTHPGTHPT